MVALYTRSQYPALVTIYCPFLKGTRANDYNDVTVAFEGNPLIAKNATMRVAVTAADKDADVSGVIRRAQDVSAVSNSIKRGIPVQIVTSD
jgi:organic hydroperoxide reductase OsmC/OhrA